MNLNILSFFFVIISGNLKVNSEQFVINKFKPIANKSQMTSDVEIEVEIARRYFKKHFIQVSFNYIFRDVEY